MENWGQITASGPAQDHGTMDRQLPTTPIDSGLLEGAFLRK